MATVRAATALPSSDPSTAALRAVGVLIGGAWLVSLLLQLTGHAAALHHHALIEDGGPPLWLGIPLFLVAWQLMIGAMMLPASVRAVRVVTASRFVARPALALGGFLGAYSLVWTGFGLVAFVGDMGLHHLVDTTPWLAARPWLIQASVLAFAGAYQLLPLRRRALDACRHPLGAAGAAVTAGPGAADVRSGFRAGDLPSGFRTGDLPSGFRTGLAHALDCLTCSWALMLVMFAAGMANLAWMAVLAAVMAYEVAGRHGSRGSRAFGLALLGLAGVVGWTGLAGVGGPPLLG